MIETEDMFLIKIDESHFVREIDGQTIACTSIPSAAFHTTYLAADRICVSLRRRRYPFAHVTDLFGSPITADMLASAPEVPAKPALPRTMHDLDSIPARDRNQRYRADEEFRQRVDQIYSKAGR